jgi:hypothetical protein
MGLLILSDDRKDRQDRQNQDKIDENSNEDSNEKLDLQFENPQIELYQGSYSNFCRFQQLVRRNYADDPEQKDKEILEKHPEIAVFTEHSDCDGGWSVAECKQVLDVITKVEDKFPAYFSNGYQVIPGYWQEKIDILKRGLECCIKENIGAFFC